MGSLLVIVLSPVSKNLLHLRHVAEDMLVEALVSEPCIEGSSGFGRARSPSTPSSFRRLGTVIGWRSVVARRRRP